ncbi:CPXCG motif-containing cysteine-rich protein [Pseudomonadota bacterium]
MNLLQESTISCPYCGEVISILVDGSVEEQQYIEDCEVCCRPMDIRVNVSANGSIQVDVHSEND